jgi:deoxyuridine 5'-triphosphate nucleotidohydrolase
MNILYRISGIDGGIHKPQFEGDGGFDLAISSYAQIDPGDMAMIPCGIEIALPKGVSGLVVGRSGWITKGLLVMNTLIDEGYRGEIYIICYNLIDEPIVIYPGTRVAQIIPITNIAEDIDIALVDQLPDSERSKAGFGSTGD